MRQASFCTFQRSPCEPRCRERASSAGGGGGGGRACPCQLRAAGRAHGRRQQLAAPHCRTGASTDGHGRIVRGGAGRGGVEAGCPPGGPTTLLNAPSQCPRGGQHASLRVPVRRAGGGGGDGGALRCARPVATPGVSAGQSPAIGPWHECPARPLCAATGATGRPRRHALCPAHPPAPLPPRFQPRPTTPPRPRCRVPPRACRPSTSLPPACTDPGRNSLPLSLNASILHPS